MQQRYQERLVTLSGMRDPYVDNGKYANGVMTDSYMNTDGSINLGTITVSAESQTSKKYDSLISDLASLAYTVFTFTPLGDAYDTISQYANGELGGVEFIGMLGLAFVPGGKIAKTLMKSKYFGVGSKLFGNSRIRTGLLNNQRSKIPIKIGWSQPEGGGGYLFRIGLGKDPINSNRAIYHIEFSSTYLPYRETDRIIDVGRRFHRRYNK